MNIIAASLGAVRFQAHRRGSHQPLPLNPQLFERLELAYQHLRTADRDNPGPVELALMGSKDTLCMQTSAEQPDAQFSVWIQSGTPLPRAPKGVRFHLSRVDGGRAFSLRAVEYPGIGKVEHPPIPEQKTYLEGFLATMIVPAV